MITAVMNEKVQNMVQIYTSILKHFKTSDNKNVYPKQLKSVQILRLKTDFWLISFRGNSFFKIKYD